MLSMEIGDISTWTKLNQTFVKKVVQCPNLMNLSRVSNPPKTGFNWESAEILNIEYNFKCELTVLEPRLKFFKFWLRLVYIF